MHQQATIVDYIGENMAEEKGKPNARGRLGLQVGRGKAFLTELGIINRSIHSH